MSAEIEGAGYTVYCIPCGWEESDLDLTTAEELAADHDATCPDIRNQFQHGLDAALLRVVDSQ